MENLLVDDFFTGLFSTLAIRRRTNFTIRQERFEKAIADTVGKFVGKSESTNVNLRFRVKTHEIHGDSTVVRDALSSAAQRGVISLDNPEFVDMRIKLTPESADMLLHDLPGGKIFFDSVVDEFLKVYS